MHREIEEVRPAVVVVDPINDLMAVGNMTAVKATLLRLIDYLKTSQITALFSSLTAGDAHEQTTDLGISSLMDTWILLRAVEERGNGIEACTCSSRAECRTPTRFPATLLAIMECSSAGLLNRAP
jgi:hypothetical protein